MKVGNINITLASGSLDEANKKLSFNSENWNIFVADIADDKSLSRTDTYLTYRGMS